MKKKAKQADPVTAMKPACKEHVRDYKPAPGEKQQAYCPHCQTYLWPHEFGAKA